MTAKPGDTVKVHYTAKDKSGKILDSSKDKEPIEFELGVGAVIEGFERAIVGMKSGEAKEAQIPMEMAYGPKMDEKVFELDKQQFPPEVETKKGKRVSIQQADGNPIPATIAEVIGEKVILDTNHPLAGKDLIFDIELLNVKTPQA